MYITNYTHTHIYIYQHITTWVRHESPLTDTCTYHPTNHTTNHPNPKQPEPHEGQKSLTPQCGLVPGSHTCNYHPTNHPTTTNHPTNHPNHKQPEPHEGQKSLTPQCGVVSGSHTCTYHPTNHPTTTNNPTDHNAETWVRGSTHLALLNRSRCGVLAPPADRCTGSTCASRHTHTLISFEPIAVRRRRSDLPTVARGASCFSTYPAMYTTHHRSSASRRNTPADPQIPPALPTPELPRPSSVFVRSASSVWPTCARQWSEPVRR